MSNYLLQHMYDNIRHPACIEQPPTAKGMRKNQMSLDMLMAREYLRPTSLANLATTMNTDTVFLLSTILIPGPNTKCRKGSVDAELSKP